MATRQEIEAEIIRRQGMAQPPVASVVPPAQRQAIDGEVGRRQAIEAEIARRQAAEAPIQPQPAQPLTQQAALEQLAGEVGPFEAAAIGAGRGLTTLGRAVGLAEPEAPITRQAFQELEEQRPIATTVGEIAGESAPFLVPGLGVAGLAGRGAQFAGAVGLGAAEAELIAKGKGADIGQQLLSAGVGGTVAGALDLALPVIGRIGGKIVRRILNKAPDDAVIDAAGNPSQEFLDALSETGQTFDDVIQEAQEELSKKAVSPREAARKAFLKSQGVDPTKAQITRNAADFQAQQEAAKTSSRVRDALERQESILTTRFNNAILETGGRSTSPTSSVVDSLTEKASKLDQEIGDLYSAARQAAPDAKNISFDKLTKKLKELLPADRRAGGNISAILGDMQSKGILNQKNKVIGRVGVEFAEDLRKLTNELYDNANPFGNMLLRQVKNDLDDDVFRAAGKDFFKKGRQAKVAFEKELSRAKISKFDLRKDNLVRDVLENKIDPDQMVDKVVFGKRWRADDLKQLKDYISTDDAGKKAFDDMRAEVMQKIKDKAFIGPVDDAGFQALSRDKLEKAVNSIGKKKLSILLSKSEQKFLRDMMGVASLREPVRGTALGRGPSAQAIGKLEQRLKNLPILGSLVDFINLDAQGRAVLKAKPTPIAARGTISPAARQAAIAPAVAITQQEQQ